MGRSAVRAHAATNTCRLATPHACRQWLQQLPRPSAS
jgi:hypothetical protein